MFELNINPEQKRGLTILFALTIGLGGFYFLNSRPQAEPVVIQEIAPAITESATARLIINVAGKVKILVSTNYRKDQELWMPLKLPASN